MRRVPLCNFGSRGVGVEPSASGGRYSRDPFGVVFDIVQRVE
jgi:hypothetical protein